jgi:hypothetical protein
MKYLFVVVLLVLASAAPAEDEVHIPIPDYTAYKWYSGKSFTI